MSILNILHYPDPQLRVRAQPVEEVTDGIRSLVDDLLETMYDAPGIGLAATQVNVHQRILVIDLSEAQNEPRVFINPQLLERRGDEEMQEGCLSVPGYFDTVRRADWVKVQAQDRSGEAFELETEGLLAVCIQHEIDHLDGKLFVDYLSELKRKRVRKKLEKQTRQGTLPRHPAQGVI